MTGAFAFDQLAPAPRPGPSGAASGPSPEDVARALAAARAEGFAEGHSAGAAEASARVASAEEALRAAAAALAASREQVADDVERAAVDLALRVAEQVVGAAIAADPELVLKAVRGALRRLVERERVIVLVHPEDLDVVRAGLVPLTAELGGVEHFEVQAERRVARGGAVVRTGEGEVDASVQTKLERAREVLDHELCG
ncbi:MAG TPA: FliH/SctL family protein [Solirubrobacteraceae bacterium]